VKKFSKELRRLVRDLFRHSRSEEQEARDAANYAQVMRHVEREVVPARVEVTTIDDAERQFAWALVNPRGLSPAELQAVEELASRLDKPYVTGEHEYSYPCAGDPLPPGGRNVLLLTEGGKMVEGPWDGSRRFKAWAEAPKCNPAKEALWRAGGADNSALDRKDRS
jgi:hypothetical protein